MALRCNATGSGYGQSQNRLIIGIVRFMQSDGAGVQMRARREGRADQSVRLAIFRRVAAMPFMLPEQAAQPTPHLLKEAFSLLIHACILPPFPVNCTAALYNGPRDEVERYC